MKNYSFNVFQIYNLLHKILWLFKKIFKVPTEGLEVSSIMTLLNKSRIQELMIEDWGISQSNLEDVFMRIVDLEKPISKIN